MVFVEKLLCTIIMHMQSVNLDMHFIEVVFEFYIFEVSKLLDVYMRLGLWTFLSFELTFESKVSAHLTKLSESD